MDGGWTETSGGELGASEDEGWRTNSRIAIWSLFLFGSIILNATLLLAFLKRPGLRTLSNRFVMNLTASNLITCVFLTVLFILNNTTSSYTPSCEISEGGTALVTTSCILTVLLIAIDQYFAVVDPLRYRSRVDKIKCGLLIASVWIIAALFASLAAFNPNPRSLWQSCARASDSLSRYNHNTTLNRNFSSNSNVSFENEDDLDLKTQVNFPEGDYSSDLEEDLELMENTTALLRTAFLESYRNFPLEDPNQSFTYGLVYSVTFSIFVYLLPFLTVSWIYISIYTAARKNSERTRRTGSRPILSSGSFCEEYYQMKQEPGEEFRRIPKISSLSSIDESSETPPSQITRSKSSELVLSSNSREQEDRNRISTVIFTVGSQEVDVAPQKADGNTKDTKVPIASLKVKFLGQRDQRPTNELVKSKFPNPPDQRRKSSHDIMYEEMMLQSSDEEMINFIGVQEVKVVEMRNLSKRKGSRENSDHSNHNHSDQTLIESSRFLNVESEMPNGFRSERSHNSKMSFASANTESSSADLLSASPNTPIVTITPPYKVPLHRVSSVRSTSSYINSLKYRISNGSIFKYREETRAARISALVIVMGLICWTPYVFVLMLRNLSNEENCLPQRFDTIVLSFLVLSTYVSPLLFGYRSKRVKRELRKFFCFRKELSYKNNRSLMAKKVLKRRHSGNLSQFEMESKYNILNCVYGRNKWPKEKVPFVHIPETALAVETCRSSFSSGASTQISSTSTDEC